MNWKDQAREQFKLKRTPDTLVAISVPEWGATVYYWPAMTLQERREIYLLAKSSEGATVLDLEAMAVSLIVRARDSGGKRIWSNAEKRELMTEYDPDIIARIVAEMNDGTVMAGDAEKNS